MKSFRHILTAAALGCLLLACGGSGKKNRADAEYPAVNGETEEPAPKEIDLFELNMYELRLLRSSAYAAHGAPFVESDLRRYWRENTAWYDTLSRSRSARLLAGEPPPALTPEQRELVGRIDARMAQLQQENYIFTEDGARAANVHNIVNLFLFRGAGQALPPAAMDDLVADNVAFLPDTLPQLFQVYLRNESLKIPNFVTVDLMAQLSHIYENWLLRNLEEAFFSTTLAELCLALYNASVEQAGRTAREDVKSMANFNAAFFAVPYSLITGRSLKISADYHSIVEQELAYIAQREDRRPALLETKATFDYGVFNPYGHYTRTADLRRYFRAWKWLQLAPYCSDNRTQLQRAALLALALQTAKTESGEPAIDAYARLTGAMNWFAGRPSGCSLLDVALMMKSERVATVNAALNAGFLGRVAAMARNAAAPDSTLRYPVACANGIYFLPQPARDGEGVSSFSKRRECIQALQRQDSLPPMQSFSQKPAWSEKILETSSALELKLKHDVLLYGIVPHHLEPLPAASPPDTLLPPPMTLGYVEPALPFWTNLRQWVELTRQALHDHQLESETLLDFTERMHRYVSLLEDAAVRQLSGERLPDDTYRFIASIGDSVQRFTLSMVEPEIDRWEWAAGTDRSVAVFKKMNRPDGEESETNDILHAATGNINNLYVVVEIDGYLYLMKGAAFSYREFYLPPEQELTDEDWQEMKRTIR